MKLIVKTAVVRLFAYALLLIGTWTACKRDDYYVDGGLANPYYEGTILEYLEAKTDPFDTIAQIIRLAGLENEFTNDEMTFFAPRDRDIKSLIGNYRINGSVNYQLYQLARDTIKTLSDVDSLIWRKYLQRYMFKGKNLLADYPQIDFDVLNVYPGQNYYSYNNSVSNIGVVYNDAVSNDGDGDDTDETTLKYMGYRQLHISYIPNISSPSDNWKRVAVISSDIQPTNGVVHALDYLSSEFGFVSGEVRDEIVESKR